MSTSNCDFQISTGARLHFGLMEICEGNPNRFGGIGLIVDSPRTTLTGRVFLSNPSGVERTKGESNTISRSISIDANEYWRDRIQSVIEPSLVLASEWRKSVDRIQCSLDSVPLPHIGLGSGTQVACAAASALYVALLGRLPEWSELLCNSRRGLRSHIGLAGFLGGGLVFDRGMSDIESGRTTTELFPVHWPVLLLRRQLPQGDSGSSEVAMFEQCSLSANPNRSEMMELASTSIPESVRTLEWDQWDQSIGRYGRLAGTIFEKVQGGVFRSPEICQIIEACSKLGCFGAAQSSWGPTVMLVARDSDHAFWLENALVQSIPDIEIEITFARNQPASFERLWISNLA